MEHPSILMEYTRIKCDEHGYYGLADWCYAAMNGYYATHPDMLFTVLELLEFATDKRVDLILRALCEAIGTLHMDFGEQSSSEAWVVGVILRYILHLVAYPEKKTWEAAYEIGLEGFYWKRLRSLADIV